MRLLFAMLCFCAMWGCARSELPDSTATLSSPPRVASVEGADVTAELPPPRRAAFGWPASDDPERDLQELARQIRRRFEEYRELEPLIYPKGWVRRALRVDDVATQLTANNSQAVVQVTYQRQSTVIHPTREQAERDEELLPYASLQSKDQMASPLRRPLPIVTLVINYARTDTPHESRWLRTGWLAEPDIAEGQDFLDRIGVP
jgi:hypothetical protein